MPTTGFVILTFLFRKEGKVWTGECQELGTATYARTIKQTHKELSELVDLHLNELDRLGVRQRIFEERGIRFYTDETLPDQIEQRVPVGDDEVFFHPHKVAVGVGA